VAISTGVYYLDKNRWCVKDLTIGHRLDETPFWFVSGLGCNFDSEIAAGGVAMDICRTMKVPFFFNVVHGQAIDTSQIEVLKDYGIIVRLI